MKAARCPICKDWLDGAYPIETERTESPWRENR